MSPLFSRDLGIDLGTIFTRISEAGEVVLVEPTVVRIQAVSGERGEPAAAMTRVRLIRHRPGQVRLRPRR